MAGPDRHSLTTSLLYKKVQAGGKTRMSSSSYRSSAMDLSFKKYRILFVIVVALLFGVVKCSRNDPFQGQYLSNRKLGLSKNATSTSTADYDWIGGGDPCSKENIYISQGQTPPLPNGIPTYTVQIQNICMSGSCSISDIHLSCGWFSSARLINPNVFRRISYDDCLVNNGNPISPGQTICFQYATTYPYPMSVSSMSCY
ncbi:hypothetical protein L1987_74162 [Smallanthus sonchifolius]|uniref:Uncharacterized protein n=1 Tax=Smallanthus sonchifolius TaxID=185202 RepID=A0ACB9A276_9ASTR|nr:hypothetical protein L1987_74162 [Smallanthus sonchifolius]